MESGRRRTGLAASLTSRRTPASISPYRIHTATRSAGVSSTHLVNDLWSVTDKDRVSGIPKNPRQVRAAVDNDKHGYRSRTVPLRGKES